MKIKIGGKLLVGQASLAVYKDEDAWIEFSIEGWAVKIKVEFPSNEKGVAEFAFKIKEDYGILSISNLHNIMPIASSQPLLFGNVNNKKAYCVINAFAIQEFKKVEISFFLEESV